MDRMTALFRLLTLILLTSAASADALQYKQMFLARVYNFGRLNRFNISNINRDKYVNCIMRVKIKTTLNAGGEVVKTEVTEPAPVPVVNSYFLYIIQQASPYGPLEKYVGPGEDQLVIEEYFRLKLGLYEYSTVNEPCK